MRVLVLSQYYPPENVFLPASLARNLAARGHEVRVLTGYPNYPFGRVYEGYQQRWRAQEADGDVQVLRVPLFTDHSANPIRRMANYVSFGLSAATARSFACGVDVVYVYATQMTPALGPWLWRLTGGAPYVLHVQDLWPDSITGSSLVKGGLGARVVDAALHPWISDTYRRAAAVIGIAPTMVATLIGRGVSPGKAHLVYNWADSPAGVASDAEGSGADASRTNFLYAGNVGDLQDLETAVQAAHGARDAGVHLTIVGAGVALPRLRALSAELGCTNVDFKGRVGHRQMGELYRTADYSLVTLKDLPVFRGTIPSKFQASLSHGLPVIATVQGDLRDLVENLEVGYTADAEDVNSLEAAFRVAAAATRADRLRIAARAREAHASHFSLAAGIAAVEGILLEAAQSVDEDKRGRRKSEVTSAVS